MMMTINYSNNLFWTTIQKRLFSTIKRIILLFLFIVIPLISCNKNENLKVKSFKTSTGWGYLIIQNEKIIIKQTIIPVITENQSFENEKQALRVGELVLQKLKNNLSPTITRKDLILLDIDYTVVRKTAIKNYQ